MGDSGIRYNMVAWRTGIANIEASMALEYAPQT